MSLSLKLRSECIFFNHLVSYNYDAFIDLIWIFYFMFYFEDNFTIKESYPIKSFHLI